MVIVKISIRFFAMKPESLKKNCDQKSTLKNSTCKDVVSYFFLPF